MHIYYGYGQGKTTAAIGLAYRCASKGYKVLFTSFLKSKKCGEFVFNGPFVVDTFEFCGKFWNDMTSYEKNCTIVEVEERLCRIISVAENYDMIVLDELLDLVSLGCVSEDCLVDFVKSIYGKTEIVITGHDKVQALFDMADYVTEMRKEKHPYDKGITARDGIEY